MTKEKHFSAKKLITYVEDRKGKGRYTIAPDKNATCVQMKDK